MKTIPTEDLIAQTAERVDQQYAEKFRQECLDRWHKKRAAKERQDKEADKPAASADH